jgi:DNA-binding transcriptional MerR regulator
LAEKKTTKKAAPKRKPRQERYIRNLRNVHVSLKGIDRRLELAPRGQRNDAVQLKKGEEGELTDVGVLCEVITATEAEKIRDKQLTNYQQQTHPAFATIRNEHGEEYSPDSIKVEQEYHHDRGEKVADLKDGQVQIDRGVGIRRSLAPGTEDRALPQIPESVPPEEQADWLARNSTQGLGDVRVSVDETQKTDDEDGRGVKPTDY